VGACDGRFVDKDADVAKAVKVVVDGKTTYPAACNATETLLVHSAVLESVRGCLSMPSV
jgi:glutamate-5-semialdehyde dehydrogenase